MVFTVPKKQENATLFTKELTHKYFTMLLRRKGYMFLQIIIYFNIFRQISRNPVAWWKSNSIFEGGREWGDSSK